MSTPSAIFVMLSDSGVARDRKPRRQRERRTHTHTHARTPGDEDSVLSRGGEGERAARRSLVVYNVRGPAERRRNNWSTCGNVR